MKIQRLMLKENLRIASLVALLGLASCIENDIPYPLVEGTIGEIVVEGLRASEDGTVASGVDIDRTARTVTLYVNDSVDVSRLKLTRLILDPRDATIELDSARCDDKEKFPFHDFASLDSLSLSANTRLDLSTSLELNVRTYQDNPWTLTVRQIVDRTVDVDGMVDHLVDPVSRVAMIYVSADQDLSNIKIRTLNLGGAYGRVTPDPSTVRDFTYPQTFYAARAGEEVWQEWKVVIEQSENGASTASSVFPMVTKATLTGSVQSGKTPVVEYKEQTASAWSTAADVKTSGTSFTATIGGLRGGTAYDYRVSVDNAQTGSGSFTTAGEVALTNGGFEDWSQDGKQWNPWPSGGTSFWGTGNPGAAAFIGNITTPTTESVSGKAALLESKDAVIKLGISSRAISPWTVRMACCNWAVRLPHSLPPSSSNINIPLPRSIVSGRMWAVWKIFGAVRTLARSISPSRISRSLTRSVPSPLSGRSSTRTTVISSPMASSSADSLPRAISRSRYPWNTGLRTVRLNISSSWRRPASTAITLSEVRVAPFG